MTYHRMRQYGCCLHEQTSLWLLPPRSAWPVRHGDTTEADWVSRMHTAWWTKTNTVLQLIWCIVDVPMIGEWVLWIYSLSQVLSFGTIKHLKLKNPSAINTRKESVYEVSRKNADRDSRPLAIKRKRRNIELISDLCTKCFLIVTVDGGIV